MNHQIVSLTEGVCVVLKSKPHLCNWPHSKQQCLSPFLAQQDSSLNQITKQGKCVVSAWSCSQHETRTAKGKNLCSCYTHTYPHCFGTLTPLLPPKSPKMAVCVYVCVVVGVCMCVCVRAHACVHACACVCVLHIKDKKYSQNCKGKILQGGWGVGVGKRISFTIWILKGDLTIVCANTKPSVTLQK